MLTTAAGLGGAEGAAAAVTGVVAGAGASAAAAGKAARHIALSNSVGNEFWNVIMHLLVDESIKRLMSLEIFHWRACPYVFIFDHRSH
jgi:hypothetical protein